MSKNERLDLAVNQQPNPKITKNNRTTIHLKIFTNIRKDLLAWTSLKCSLIFIKFIMLSAVINSKRLLYRCLHTSEFLCSYGNIVMKWTTSDMQRACEPNHRLQQRLPAIKTRFDEEKANQRSCKLSHSRSLDDSKNCFHFKQE